MPVFGIVLVTTAILSTACRQICTVIPVASIKPNRSGAFARHRKTANRKQDKQKNDEQRANQAELFANNSKYKIVIRFGKVKIFLPRCADAASQQPARTDGDQGLHRLPRLIVDIRKRIEPELKAFRNIGNAFKGDNAGDCADAKPADCKKIAKLSEFSRRYTS